MRKRAIALMALAAFSHGARANAQTMTVPPAVDTPLKDWLAQGQIDGVIRAYDFDRLYGSPNVTNQSAFALAGILNLRSAPFLGGFSVGVSPFTATSLGINNTKGPPGFPHLDATMIGAANSLTALGQAYLQYSRPWLLVRVGDQEITTPWLGISDCRVLPATYQGVFGEIQPLPGLQLIGLRQLAWKSRTSSTYFRDNLYYPSTFDGDAIYGGSAALPASASKSLGTLAFGTSYAGNGVKANAWYYDFYNFTNMFYGDASYTLTTKFGIDPFVAGQYLRGWDGDSILNADHEGLAIDGVKGNGVHATAYGFQFGVNYALDFPELGSGNIAFSYNNIPQQRGSIGEGAIVSPYTVGYATDPLYTTALIRGLVELGPGDAKRVALTQHFFGTRITAVVAFSRFDTKLNGGSNDTYADLTYAPGGKFKGLSIRDRMEVSNASFKFNNGATGNHGHSFVYNRVMLQYAF